MNGLWKKAVNVISKKQKLKEDKKRKYCIKLYIHTHMYVHMQVSEEGSAGSEAGINEKHFGHQFVNSVCMEQTLKKVQFNLKLNDFERRIEL